MPLTGQAITPSGRPGLLLATALTTMLALPCLAQPSATAYVERLIEQSKARDASASEPAPARVNSDGDAAIAATSTPARAAPTEDITEIEVLGTKLFSTLEHQIREADEVLYGIFNELNDDDYYDVHCDWESRPNTNIRYWECRPGFLQQATAADAVSFHNSITGFMGTHAPPPQAVIAHEYPRLQEKMREALKDSPELFEAVLKSYELRQELADKKTIFWEEKADD